MDIEQVLGNLRVRPGIWGIDGSFGQVAAFLEGVDIGQGRTFLAGFREWLVVRVGSGFNLMWRGLVLHCAFPEGLPGGFATPLDRDQNERATSVLLDELAAFFEVRNDPDGHAGIYVAYSELVQNQGWHPLGNEGRAGER